MPLAASIKLAAMFLPVHITANDYEYDGYLAAVFRKRSGAVRYIVEDDKGRLFVHNAKQLGVEEGWWPEQAGDPNAPPSEQMIDAAARIIHRGAFDEDAGSEPQRHEARTKATRVLALRS